MTAAQKIKLTILKDYEMSEAGPFEVELTEENVDKIFDELESTYALQDYIFEFRSSWEEETKIKCDWSRNYESKSVAKQVFDGSWVGWTYWYGGGKHGEPEAIDWIDDAYNLDCQEERVMIMERTFNKI